MREYIIRLPWPPKNTSPNRPGQGKWRAKSEAAKGYKTACAWECARQRVKPVLFDSAHVEVTFHPPDNRRRDLDNMLASAKQGMDAVSEAIMLDDSAWHRMTLVRGPKVKNGCILVHVMEAGAKAGDVPIVGQVIGDRVVK